MKTPCMRFLMCTMGLAAGALFPVTLHCAQKSEKTAPMRTINVRCTDGFGKALFAVDLCDNQFAVKRFASDLPSHKTGMSILSVTHKEADIFLKQFDKAFNDKTILRTPGQSTLMLTRSDSSSMTFSILPQQPSSVQIFYTAISRITSSNALKTVWSISLDARTSENAGQKPALSVTLHRSNPDLDGLDSIISLETSLAESYDSVFHAVQWIRTEKADNTFKAGLLNKKYFIVAIKDEKARWAMVQMKVSSQKSTAQGISEKDIWHISTAAIQIR